MATQTARNSSARSAWAAAAGDCAASPSPASASAQMSAIANRGFQNFVMRSLL
ncbi:Uncharacterised protein [Flavonifractor plautii]|uniref:Uncharacterized protein n=1 Tax=Flavonifractor plautii TaxID=292800 RepID=A0A174T0U2_FLAPL|nr:Uncharacterised protein [Flavonifractor plautii]